MFHGHKWMKQFRKLKEIQKQIQTFQYEEGVRFFFKEKKSDFKQFGLRKKIEKYQGVIQSENYKNW